MATKENKDTRYFIDIDLATRKVIGTGFDHKDNLEGGKQTRVDIHRLFLTVGQYNKFISRVGNIG